MSIAGNPNAQAALATIGVLAMGGFAAWASFGTSKSRPADRGEIKIINKLTTPIQLYLVPNGGVPVGIQTISSSSSGYMTDHYSRKARVPGARIMVLVDGGEEIYQLFELGVDTHRITIGKVVGKMMGVSSDTSRSPIDGPGKVVLANYSKTGLTFRPGGSAQPGKSVTYQGGGSHQGVALGTIFHESIHEDFRLDENYTHICYGLIEQA